MLTMNNSCFFKLHFLLHYLIDDIRLSRLILTPDLQVWTMYMICVVLPRVCRL